MQDARTRSLNHSEDYLRTNEKLTMPSANPHRAIHSTRVHLHPYRALLSNNFICYWYTARDSKKNAKSSVTKRVTTIHFSQQCLQVYRTRQLYFLIALITKQLALILIYNRIIASTPRETISRRKCPPASSTEDGCNRTP
jgi:hypothetical protein